MHSGVKIDGQARRSIAAVSVDSMLMLLADWGPQRRGFRPTIVVLEPEVAKSF
jgi:hypothetical protein